MELPDYKMVQGGNTRVNMSVGAATQAGKAFASMGKDLENAGMQVSGIFEEAEKQHNIGKMADLKLELDQTMSAFQQEMASNPNDALQWRDKFGKIMDSKRAELEKRDMSRGLREQSMSYFKQFEGQGGISVSHTAHKTILDNAKQSVDALITDARLRKDFDAADSFTDQAEREGTLSSSTALSQKLRTARERKTHDRNTLIVSDPYAAEDAFLTGKFKFDNVIEQDEALRLTRQRQDMDENVTTDEINEKIYSGQPITEDEIAESFHPDANVARASAIKGLREYNNLALQERRAMPQYQERLDGQLHAMTQDLDVTASGYQDKRRNAVNLINQITNKASKDEWMNVINRIDAREPKFQKAADAAIENLGKQGLLKIPKLEAEEVSFEEYLRDGHLGTKTLTEATTLPPHIIKKIDKLSRLGDYKGAIELFGNQMRGRGRGGYKADIKPWQQDFLVPLTSQKAPTLTSTAHIKEGTAEQLLQLEREQQIYGARTSRVKEDLRARIGDKNIEDIPASELDEHVRFLFNMHSEESIIQSMEEDEAAEIKANKLNVNYNATSFRPDEKTRIKNFEKGEFYVSLDANKASGVPVTQPLAVLPKEASPELRKAASIFTGLMADLHREEFGRDFKARVVTSGDLMDNGQPWRGKSLVTHLEGFAITDKEMVAFLKTERGRAKYRQILNQSFSNIHGITLGLPHTATDSGAVDDDTQDSEVSLAKYILGDTESKQTDIAQSSFEPVAQGTTPEPKSYKLKDKSYKK